tara:strand:+ start:594 stop:866 length:273 start_codon:yes stop_codon:yes gene_type:complete
MRISKEKKDKIFEQILAFLYSQNPKALFTSTIAREIARDEEFVKKLLLELKEKKFVVDIRKNSKGISYLKRIRWRLSDHIYNTYKNHQNA